MNHRERFTFVVLLASVFVLFTACGTTNTPSGSESSSDTAGLRDRPWWNNGNGQGGQTDQEALASCLAKFPGHPFTQDQMRTARTIRPTVSVLGRGSELRDANVTVQPELVLIETTVAVLTHARYELLNPNGWYCWKVNVNVGARTEIFLKQQAHLSDTSTAVNVGSNGNAAGNVVVDVGSNVVINRVN